MWPINPVYRTDAYRKSAEVLFGYIQDLGRNQLTARSLAALSKYILYDVLCYIEGHKVIEAIDQGCCDDEEFFKHSDVACSSGVIEKLRLGPKRNSCFFRWINWNLFVRNPYVKRSVSIFFGAKRGFEYCTSFNSLMVDYAKSTGLKGLVYATPDQWLRSSKIESRPEIKKITDRLVSDFLVVASDCGKIKPNEKDQVNLLWWLPEAISITSSYLSPDYKFLPEKIFIGNVGDLWVSILREVMAKNGCHVTTFSHGRPFFEKDLEAMQVLDLQRANRYVCHYSYEIDLIRANFNAKLGSLQGIEFCSVYPDSSLSEYTIRPLIPKSPKILVISGPYAFTIPSRSGIFNAPVYLSWHLKLIKKLLSFGFRVSYRPYPGGVDLTRYVSAIEGVDIDLNDFVSGVEKHDLVILDNPLSTTFFQLFQLLVPCIFINFGFTRFDEKAKGLFSKKFYWMNGFLDMENGPQIDFEALLGIIKGDISEL